MSGSLPAFLITPTTEKISDNDKDAMAQRQAIEASAPLPERTASARQDKHPIKKEGIRRLKLVTNLNTRILGTTTSYTHERSAETRQEVETTQQLTRAELVELTENVEIKTEAAHLAKGGEFIHRGNYRQYLHRENFLTAEAECTAF